MSQSPMPSSLERIKASVRRVPPLDALVRARQHRQFLSTAGYTRHWGVYRSFEEARRALPASHEFDEAPVVESILERGARIYAYDYPPMFWLDRAFRKGTRSVFDIGGSIGVHYYGYGTLLAFPPQLQWTVCEVPATVEVGRRLAAQRGEHRLAFTDTLAPSEVHAALWLSAGALQYIEQGDLPQLVAAAGSRPQHVLLNKVPLYDGDDFVSTQNIGPGIYAPVWIWSRARLLERMQAQGYRVIDSWDVPERDFYLPGYPQRSFKYFSGLYFEAESVTH